MTIAGSPTGNSTLVTGVVNIDTTIGGVLIAVNRGGRADITVVNEGTTDVRLGPQGVTAATGLLLVGIKGAAVTISTGAALYGIVATGSQAVSFAEDYGA